MRHQGRRNISENRGKRKVIPAAYAIACVPVPGNQVVNFRPINGNDKPQRTTVNTASIPECQKMACRFI